MNVGNRGLVPLPKLEHVKQSFYVDPKHPVHEMWQLNISVVPPTSILCH